MTRWVFNFYFFAIRIHHWKSSDDPRHFHDHPWWFLSWVIKGSLIDRTVHGDFHRKRWSLALFKPEHQHTVIIPKGGCWTILITGRERRQWGFWVNGKFKKRNRYFWDFGTHPCDS